MANISSTFFMLRLAVALAAATFPSSVEASAVLQTSLYDPKTLLATRAKVKAGTDATIAASYNLLVKSCPNYLPTNTSHGWDASVGPWSVLNKTLTLPAGVSKHEYLSIGIYNHPCNNLPKGCKALVHKLIFSAREGVSHAPAGDSSTTQFSFWIQSLAPDHACDTNGYFARRSTRPVWTRWIHMDSEQQ
jgi:hypothetical protein